jgi:TatD DNase family protein
MHLVDTHCHLDFPDFADDRDEVVDRAAAAGVDLMVNIGTCLESSRLSIRLADFYDEVHATAGIHPNHCTDHDNAALEAVVEMAGHEHVVAVGETGLDFYRDTTPPEIQRRYFRRQMEAASELGKPVVIHSRDSGEAVMEMVEAFQAGSALTGVFHCFTSTEAVLERALAAGLKIGISGILTFPKGDNVRALIPRIPDDHLLLDTDSPFLAPVPHRGKRNEPAYAVAIAEKLAEIRGVSLADIARITTRNACELFGLPSPLADEGEGSAIAYTIRNSLYLSLTNQCTNACVFCARNRAYRVKGHDIHLERDPSAAEVIDAMGETGGYDEVVFCGFGEPTMRLEVLTAVADELKRRGKTVRLNTNGLGSLYHGRDIVPDLAGRIDVCSVSLNTADPAQYAALCRPQIEGEAFAALCDFVRKAAAALPKVVCTTVEMPEVDTGAARALAESLGAEFRLRSYVDVG